MIKFVNAKINIGLNIIGKRPDGYHELQTIFYPIGIRAGGPDNPTVFNDILEVIPSTGNIRGFELEFHGDNIECGRCENLVWKAADLYFKKRAGSNLGVHIILDKHLPIGAGLGGGSADASFLLKALTEADDKLNSCPNHHPMTDKELATISLSLGADCPFFIYNVPMYAEGIGEILSPIDLNLSNYWICLVKPKIHISTKEAFAGIKPTPSEIDLRTITSLPIDEWQKFVKNDFEKNLFPKFPKLKELKDELISGGAIYSSMSGSGSTIYGIFSELESTKELINKLRKDTTIERVYLLKM